MENKFFQKKKPEAGWVYSALQAGKKTRYVFFVFPEYFGAAGGGHNTARHIFADFALA